MKTAYKILQDISSDSAIFLEAAEIIRRGGLVAFPTETVYGLGADGLDEKASAKIYEAKGRPSDNPLILHICSLEQLNDIAKNIPPEAMLLAERFWPGPLTMIFQKKDIVPYGTTGGLDTVAVRMPDHAAALALIQAAGVPIAAPSANTSGRPSPTIAADVKEDMNGRIDMILDGGEVGIGLESTIVDFTGDKPTILRPGFLTPAALVQIVPGIVLDVSLLSDRPNPGVKPKAPGMKYRHYSPLAELTIYKGTQASVAAAINAAVLKRTINGCLAGVLATEETKELYRADIVLSVGTRQDELTIAHNLYRILREFDREGAAYIYSEDFSGGTMGQAIMDRLVKAAGHRVISV